MTFPPAHDTPLPVSADKFKSLTGLKVLPTFTLVDLADLSRQTEDGNFDPTDFLTRSELKQYQSYIYPKRKLEWLGGRLAVKQAVAELLRERHLSTPLDWQITPDEHGRPFVKPVQQTFAIRPVEISISHSNNLCAALANHDRQCGIDIQKKSSAVIRVREKFCTDKEKNVSETMDTITSEKMRLTLLWSAKESLRKALGGYPLTGFLEMNLTGIERLTDGCWSFSFQTNAQTLQVITFIYQDYGCSMAFG